ncbi:MAG TPA: hypothetical protein VF815_16950 [Myxococcaceae bacterium]|jgi:hypothetical protein
MNLRAWFVASSLFLASACGGPVEVEPQEPAPVTDAAQAAPEDGNVSAQWISCPQKDGTSCTTPGSYFKCYNQYPYEPGICRCQSDYTYLCN